MGDFLSELSANLGLSSLNDKLKPYFKYRTPKYILVEVPLVGIIHRVCQVLALVYVVVTMVTKSTWAVATVPLGSTMPWIEDNGYAKIGRETTSYSEGFEYCSNRTFAYDYGGGWQYGTNETPPECSSPNRHTISEKTADSVFVTTAYIESIEFGFACTGDSAADKANCTLSAGAGATVAEYASGQCVCTSASKTFYPLAVEQMAVAFQHFYSTPTLVASQQISGGSDTPDAKHPLRTTFIMANCTEMKWDPPEIIEIPLRDLLLGAEHATCSPGNRSDLRDGEEDGICATGIHLDEPNTDARYEPELRAEATSTGGKHHPVAVARIEPRA